MNVLILIDRVFNWISGGNFHNTISARVGYFSANETGAQLYVWNLFEAGINLAFYPIDGPEHCYNAFSKEYSRDNSNDFRRGSKLAILVLSIILAAACVPIGISLWLVKLLLNA